MWNSFELHIPLNGCKGTNISAIFQIFPHFSYKNCKKSHRHSHRHRYRHSHRHSNSNLVPSSSRPPTLSRVTFKQSQRDA